MSALLTGIALGVVFTISHLGNKKKNKYGKIPVCYYCGSKDTLNIHPQTNMFYCTFCEKVIDESNVRLFYKHDYQILMNNREDYEKFKQERRNYYNL